MMYVLVTVMYDSAGTNIHLATFPAGKNDAICLLMRSSRLRAVKFMRAVVGNQVADMRYMLQVTETADGLPAERCFYRQDSQPHSSALDSMRPTHGRAPDHLHPASSTCCFHCT